MDFGKYSGKLLNQLSQGLLLVSGSEKPNIMTIGWASIGVYWGKPMFVAVVRPSRYTHSLLEANGEFTVNMAWSDFKKELGICGTVSGRDRDKFELCGYTPLPSKNVSVPIIDKCNLHVECKVAYYLDMNPDTLDMNYDMKWYKGEDYHTIYFGEILDCYERS
jgi:flavin reductase (DIM6/NTAB) family NADH-FMN oxidoreductase RutF